MEIYDENAYHDECSSYDALRYYCHAMYHYIERIHSASYSPSLCQLGFSLIHNVFSECLQISQNPEFSQHHAKRATMMFFEYLGQSKSLMVPVNPMDAYRFVIKNTIQLIPIQRRMKKYTYLDTSTEIPTPTAMLSSGIQWNSLQCILSLWFLVISTALEKRACTSQVITIITDMCQSLLALPYSTVMNVFHKSVTLFITPQEFGEQLLALHALCGQYRE